MLWARLLVYVTGTVNQELLLRNEYLATENRILKGQIKGRLLLSEGEKVALAEIAHRLGRVALEQVAATAKPETILGWFRARGRPASSVHRAARTRVRCCRAW
jgi:putative transposase